MSSLINRRNQTFGFLTAVKRDWTKQGSHSYWICRCKCNNIVSVRADHLGSDTLSCGCYNTELRLKQRENHASYTFPTNRHRFLYYTFVKPVHDYIKKRDNNECVLCGKQTDLHIHHILRKSQYPEYLVEPNNLVCMCSSCHFLDAHNGDTNKINIELSFDLLAIVFRNSQVCEIPENIINLTKQKMDSFLSNN